VAEPRTISFTLNGKPVTVSVPPRTHLADMLRRTLELTGTHTGCEHGTCGACNVLLNGRSIRSCLFLAVQADGAEIETIEGLTARGAIADLQDEFVRRNALQCGYCTPGILATATELLAKGAASRAEIREALSGNYCRCTGYHAIVGAIEATMAARGSKAK
jgi:carbon-monoxide dehydrogenase small subunit